MLDLFSHHLYDAAHPDQAPRSTVELGVHGLIPCVAGIPTEHDGQQIVTWIPLWDSALWYDRHGRPTDPNKFVFARFFLGHPCTVSAAGTTFRVGDKVMLPATRSRWRRYRWVTDTIVTIAGYPVALGDDAAARAGVSFEQAHPVAR